jgi:hypothetical protein
MPDDGRRPEEHTQRSALLRDAHGRATDDPASAVSAEVVERGPGGVTLRRRRFFLERSQLPWLPVGEAAFLLWVLGALVAVWVVVALVLRFS